MHYSLTREFDGAGDSGPLSKSINLDTLEVSGDRPVVGNVMQVGSLYARTYECQDWWMTTPVIEILEEHEKMVRFRTENSTYIWKKY